MSENIESMISKECKSEAEHIADLLVKMTQPTEEKLEAFLKALDFIEYWEKKTA